MRIAISNIAWSAEHDRYMYGKLKEMGVDGLEIAPTRLFPGSPYDRLTEAENFADSLQKEYGLSIPSMQSIWYGRSERIWGSPEERAFLLEYTKKAIDFASAINCHNLVFGCPKNRIKPEDGDIGIAVDFFKELGDFAAKKGTCIGLEANPTIYGTNFINTTTEAIEFIEQVESEGLKLNLDIGTMIYNDESVDVLKENERLINHVHISEPGLKMVEQRKIHGDIMNLLIDALYDGFVSIEMGNVGNVDDIIRSVLFIVK